MNYKAQFGKVAVLLGGKSAEREVSLRSGEAVLEALREAGVDAYPFDPAQRPLEALQGFDRAFIALHGRFGEDGVVQGALEWLGIPYTGSDVMASALCMDKWRTKLLWQAAGIPTPAYAVLDDGSNFDALEKQLGLPLMVKPAREGSSIGLSKVTQSGELVHAYKLAREYDPLIIAEQFITGQELTIGILGDKALPAIWIEPADGLYDYHTKYFRNDTQYHCPSGLDAAVETHLQNLALRAFAVAGCRGWGRLDVMLDAQQQPYFLEINTSPGMTDHSLVPMAARQAGLSFSQLVLTILQQTVR